MIKLDDNLLQELGLGVLPPEEKKKMLAHIYETLEMRVGMALAKQMNDGQLNEFEQFIKSNDEAGALRWLETNFPNYRDVVAAEFEKLKAEVKQSAPQILAASQQQAAAPGQAMPNYAQPPMPQQPVQPQGMDGGWPQGGAQSQQQYAPQPQMPPQGYAQPQQSYAPQPMPQQPAYGPQGPQPQNGGGTAQQNPTAGAAGQPYYDPQQVQAQPPQTGQPQGQPFDPQQQQQASQQPYPPQPQGPQAPTNYQQQ